jgi:hypothetical protein
MKRSVYCLSALMALLALNLNALAEEISREQVGELLQVCQAQRQQKIAPLKAEAIEDCVTRRGKDRDHCQRFNQNYGERTTVGSRIGMFWDLPACQRAVNAQQYFQKYPGRHVYSTP